jgi:hypothetical protein
MLLWQDGGGFGGAGAGSGGPRGRGGQIDPVFLALSKLRRRQFDACIEICTNLLAENPLDQVQGYVCRVGVQMAGGVRGLQPLHGLAEVHVKLLRCGEGFERPWLPRFPCPCWVTWRPPPRTATATTGALATIACVRTHAG